MKRVKIEYDFSPHSLPLSLSLPHSQTDTLARTHARTLSLTLSLSHSRDLAHGVKPSLSEFQAMHIIPICIQIIILPLANAAISDALRWKHSRDFYFYFHDPLSLSCFEFFYFFTARLSLALRAGGICDDQGFAVSQFCPWIQTRPARSEFRHYTASDICTGTIELKKGTKCFRRASEKYGTILHTETCLLEWVCAGSQNKRGKVAVNR